MQAAIGYLRVSTHEQARSGLGLAALPRSNPLESAKGFQSSPGIKTYRQGLEPTLCNCRPGLAAALKEAKSAHCSLIVSRLDRLSRNVHFI